MLGEDNIFCSWPFAQVQELVNLLMDEADDLHAHEDVVDFGAVINNIIAAGQGQDVCYWSRKLKCCRIYKRYEFVI